MFENLRQAFQEAIDNFQRELDRDRLPDTVDELLHWMRDEIVDVQTRAKKLGDERRAALAERDEEATAAATCRRREELARKIGDQETVTLAIEHAERHERRAEVLRQKAEALAAEAELREEEARQMIEAYNEARSNRSVLAARLGRTKADRTVRSVDGLFEDLDRMDDRTSDLEVEMDSMREVELDLGGMDPFEGAVDRTGLTDAEADEALRELKRRMGK